MRTIFVAEEGDYLINLYTKEIKQALWIFPHNGEAIVQHARPDSPEFTSWLIHEYLVIPYLDPALLDE